ncbi:MAG: VWA domain-containing protein [Acidobacteriota bacterium]
MRPSLFLRRLFGHCRRADLASAALSRNRRGGLSRRLPLALPLLLTLPLLLALLLPLVVLPAQAEARAQSRDSDRRAGTALEPLVDSVDVHIVNVDVVVTNRRGEVVRGLTREDFELYEDGDRVEITNFAVVDGGAASSQETSASGEPKVEVAVEAEPPPPLHLVVYVDNRNLMPRNRNRLLPAVESFLERQLRPQDPVMLVVSDGSLEVTQPFTEDRSALIAAMEPLQRRTSRSMLEASESERVASEIARADDNTGSDATIQAEMFRNARDEDILIGLDALARFTTGLAGLPGRKAVLYLSDGFGMNNNSLVALQRITAAANASGVTFYSLDGQGPSGPPDPETPNLEFSPDSPLSGNLTGERRRVLQQLADDTGGFAVTNTLNFDGGLEQVGSWLTTSYSLAFSPDREADGEFHQLEVKVKGRGLRAQHRAGYMDKARNTRLADRTLAALQFDRELDNPLGLTLQRPPGSGELIIILPLDKLTLIPQADAHRGQVQLLVTARDAEGNILPARDILLPIAVPNQRMATNPPPVVGYKVQLSGEEAQLAVGAEDLVSKLGGLARATG